MNPAWRFPELLLSPPARVLPQRLLDLAATLSQAQYRAHLPRALRSGDHDVMRREGLKALVAEGHLAGLNRQEWMRAIDGKAELDREKPEQALASARAMWRMALHEAVPRKLLLDRVGLYLAADQGGVARSLLDTFDTFASEASAEDEPIADLISTLLEQDAINAADGVNLTFDILKGYLLQQLGLED